MSVTVFAQLVRQPPTCSHAPAHRTWHAQPGHRSAAALTSLPTHHGHQRRRAAAGRRNPTVLPRAGSNGGSSQGGDNELGVVIVDHGSRKAEANESLFEFVDLYKQVTGRQLVEVAHMELAEPTIEQAVARCAAAGARRVIIAPYFLSRGRHVQQDIPELASAAAAAHPSVECVVAEPIGIDALMAQLIEHRVQAAEAEGSAVARPVSNAAAAQ
ncbi:hypothetical protein D9Q98_010115 [Chlorella vulgaris]|uniref:Sirohydrochlorin cobaltochelatase n=1 Tax=Chlorella vulgaris TaxID=3077 RepID=A0A9D4YWA5_CHLVU|nr:hypothetical protein D9Q98_010115 [Chlorella vulgaris]